MPMVTNATKVCQPTTDATLPQTEKRTIWSLPNYEASSANIVKLLKLCPIMTSQIWTQKTGSPNDTQTSFDRLMQLYSLGTSPSQVMKVDCNMTKQVSKQIIEVVQRKILSSPLKTWAQFQRTMKTEAKKIFPKINLKRED